MERLALLSTFDKENVDVLARGLKKLNFTLLSTGRTARFLKEERIDCRDVSKYTKQDELMEGRVKTLHPAIHAGILARRNKPEDMEELCGGGFLPIDLVAVNLYPFQATVQRGATEEEILENIDIGGPTLIRAAAKNYPHVLVLVDPADYLEVIKELEKGTVDREFRRRLAVKAFAHTAVYEAAIADYFQKQQEPVPCPNFFHLQGTKVRDLRYGENPQQAGALYRTDKREGTVVNSRQLAGKPLSYNNLLDAEAALNVVLEFDKPACSIIKHNNPCGVGLGERPKQAVERALLGDPLSAYGSVIGLNRTLAAATARLLVADADFVEVVIAPDIEEEACTILQKRWRNVRLLTAGPLAGNNDTAREVRSLRGGFLLQQRDMATVSLSDLKVVTEKKPTVEELEELLFAWRIAKHVKSNAIVLTRGFTAVGIGAGQLSRVDAARIATWKAGDRAKDASMASDAMIPFPDTLEVCREAGVKFVIQPGGSLRDQEVIKKADSLGMAMVFTGSRHFRH